MTGKLCPTLTATRDREGGDNNALVRFVDKSPKACHTAYRRSDQPQTKHIPRNRLTPNLCKNNRKLRHLPFDKSLQKERASYIKKKNANLFFKNKETQPLTPTTCNHFCPDLNKHRKDVDDYKCRNDTAKTKPPNPDPTVHAENRNEPCCSYYSRDTYNNWDEISDDDIFEKQNTIPYTKDYYSDTDSVHYSCNIRQDTKTVQCNTGDKNKPITNPSNHARDTKKSCNDSAVRQERSFLKKKKSIFQRITRSKRNSKIAENRYDGHSSTNFKRGRSSTTYIKRFFRKKKRTHE